MPLDYNSMQPNWTKLAQMGVYPEGAKEKELVETIVNAEEELQSIQEEKIEEDKKNDPEETGLICPICQKDGTKLVVKTEGGLRLHLLIKHKLGNKKAAEEIKKAERVS